MRLLPYPVTLILFAVTVIATPPPGYVKRPDDDKDPPNYQYKYEIGDIDGKEGQGKVETRSGELASGRYYVNDEQSSTDVKYFADEWGYHPLVKYSASGDHSAATTHFALGEHVVKSLLNGSEVGEEVKLSGQKGRSNQLYRQHLHRRRRPIQVIQPYTTLVGQDTSVIGRNEGASLKSQLIEDHELTSSDSSTASSVSSPLNYELQRTISQGSASREAVTGFQQNFNNYVTLPHPSSQESSQSAGLSANNQEALQEIAFSRASTTPDYRSYSGPNIYVTNPSTLRSLSSEEDDGHENSNDLFSTVADDLLVVQNAGSFGRRLKPVSPKIYANSGEFQTQSKGTESSVQSSYEASTSRPIFSTISSRNTYSDRGASSYASYSTTTPRTSISYSTEVDDGRHYSTTAIPDFQDIQNSVSQETSSNDYKNSIADFHQDNSVASAYAGVFSKIFPSSEAQHSREQSNSLLTGNSPLIHYGGLERNENLTKSNGLTTPVLSSYGKRRDHELYVTLRQSLDSEIRDLPLVQSSTPQTVSTFNSKPIVVAELYDYNRDKGFEYSTTFPCKDEGLESSTIVPSVSSTVSSLIDAHDTVLVTPKLQASHSHITTSSVILNPIQAGVSLVNAGETELITSDEQLNRSPAPVSENIEGESGVDVIKNLSVSQSNELGKLGTETRVGLYEKINPAFGQPESESEAIGKSIVNSGTLANVQSDVPVVENSQDQQIEIQKSVEIYQNAPVHEIHYPAQVITQVSGINHQQQQQYQQPQEQHQQNVGTSAHQQEEHSSYLQLQEVGNAKQFQQEEERYNVGQVEHREQHQSLNTQISLENSPVAPASGTAYLGNLVRHDHELVDYSGQQNSHNQVLNQGQEDHVNIIKLIRENIPEVKYTPAKSPQINVQVYRNDVAEGNNQQQIETHQEAVDIRQQLQAEADADQDRVNKARSQLQTILSESESVQRYFNGADWTRFQTQQDERHQEHQQQVGLQEAAQLEFLRSKPVKEENHETVNDERTGQQQQSILVPYAQYHSANEKNLQQNFGNIVEEIGKPAQAGPLLYQAPLVAERIVEKTVHVPQPYPVEVPKIIEKKVPYPVEKIVEKKVPYPVEKIIEKKVPVPQPYPVHIQVPVDRVVEKQVQILQPYPVHVEKIIEKKVPYPVQRLVPQPYPVHILQPYPVEKIIEKPVHIPVTIEKIVEKKVHVPHPYPVQVPIKVPYPVEVTKYVEQTVQVPYGVRYGVSYQQIMKPQSSHGLYAPQGSTSVPLYGLSLVSNQYRDHNRVNATQQAFQGYNYNKPAIAFVTGRVDPTNNQQISNGWEQFAYGKASGLENQHHPQGFAKKSYSSYSPKLSLSSHPSYGYSSLNRRHAPHRQSNSVGTEKAGGKDEYVGPVPALQQHKPQQQVELSQSNPHQKSRSRSSSDQQQQQLQLQPLQQHLTAVTRAALVSTSVASSRRARQQQQQQQENQPHYQTGPGAFRQSKIEYGFKPPMIPSVQYDEKTATKVEN